MKENEFPLLRVTNIEWDKDHEEFDKLPKNLELRWDSKKWNVEQVSNWLSIKFDWIFDGLNNFIRICLDEILPRFIWSLIIRFLI